MLASTLKRALKTVVSDPAQCGHLVSGLYNSLGMMYQVPVLVVINTTFSLRNYVLLLKSSCLVNISSSDKPWISSKIKVLINKRQKLLHKVGKESPRYKEVRNAVFSECAKCKFFFFTARLLSSNRRTLSDSGMKLKVSVECDVITTGLNKCCLISYPLLTHFPIDLTPFLRASRQILFLLLSNLLAPFLRSMSSSWWINLLCTNH